MPNKYAPTVNPGDTRVRCYRLRINNPNGGQPTVIIYEEIVIRLADGTEQHLKDLGAFEVPFDPSEIITQRNPADDQETGGTVVAGATMADVYSFTRQKQTERDGE